jgi:hypothetical protein
VERLSKDVACFVHVYSLEVLPSAVGGCDEKPEVCGHEKEVSFKND